MDDTWYELNLSQIVYLYKSFCSNTSSNKIVSNLSECMSKRADELVSTRAC